MAALKAGDKAPDFSLAWSEGGMVSLRSFRGKKLVLYFYPKDDTSGCTKEACDFRDNLARVKRHGAAVLGVSPDPIDSHGEFIAKYNLPFPLASDESKEMLRAYGVWKEKSMYGRKYMGVERTTFVIDEKGTIAHIFPKVKVEGHVDEVLGVL